MWAPAGNVLTSFEPPTPDEQPPVMFITQVDIGQRGIVWRQLNNSLPNLGGVPTGDALSTPKGRSGSFSSDTLYLPNTDSFLLASNLPPDTNWLTHAGASWSGTDPLFPYNLPKGLELPYDQNHLTFHYSGMKLAEQKDVVYRHSLVGYDKQWSPISTEAKADYRNIPPGAYIFKVRSRGRNFLWSEEGSFSFIVHPPWWQTVWAYAGYVVLFVIVVWLLVRIQTARLKQRQKELETKVNKATIEIRQQKEAVEEQKEVIEEKQKEIIDSINYAQRIQEALLKSEENESPHLPPHFMLFKPKDIVSGDFYWALEKQGHLYLTAADCTGHGVPGAFLTMLGTSFLNEINAHEELLAPAEILNKLRERIINELSQTGAAGENKDGMDMSLARIDLTGLGNGLQHGKVELQWAGANNPLWVIRKDSTELLEIKANKQPIGHHTDMRPFDNHVVQLYPGDGFYLFSDGFPDQFGGPKGKKFKYRPFKQLLIDSFHKPPEEQKAILDRAFEEWKGDLEPVDDVVVIGVML